MKPRFFASPAAFRAWLVKHHLKAGELLVGFYKVGSGRPSMTWPESIDQALCFGWIDGVRRRVDDISYTIRFSPRRRGSIWSEINAKRAAELDALGLMSKAGLDALAKRKSYRSGIYSYEQRTASLPPPYAAQLSKHKAAAAFFDAQPPSYRKKIGWWVVCAKKEETRLSRLDRLIKESARGRRVG